MKARARVERLRQEAGQAGDVAQVAICDRALEGDEDAARECERAMAEARAR